MILSYYLLSLERGIRLSGLGALALVALTGCSTTPHAHDDDHAHYSEHPANQVTEDVVVPEDAMASKNNFARVYLSLRGCASCAPCRSDIRQLVKSKTPYGAVRLSKDTVEIRYTTPRDIPLRDVIHRMADNRLHNLELVDVRFDAEGFIEKDRNGAFWLRLPETGQRFPLSIKELAKTPPMGPKVRVEARVIGWRERDDELLLEAEHISQP